MNQEIDRKLQDIFCAVLGMKPNNGITELSRKDTAKWDSLAHVMLVSAMENEFSVNISIAESLDIDSFRYARAVLEAKLQGATKE